MNVFTAKTTSNRKAKASNLSDEDKSVIQASAFSIISEAILMYFLYNGELKDALITIGIFALVLFMDSRTQKVKKKYEKERQEANKARAVEEVSQRELDESRERSRKNNFRTMDAVHYMSSGEHISDTI